MAQNDIMPWADESGTTPSFSYGVMNASETFRIGEPISINADGEITESADDPVAMDFAGIAMAPAGYSINGTATTKDPRTGAAYTTGSLIPYIKALPGRQFIGRYFATDGSGTDLLAAGIAYATALALVGEAVGITLVNGNWVVDSTPTVDREVFRIEAFLDANKVNILFNGGTAKYVVVSVIQSQWMPITDAAGSLASIA